jgi:hypothetical protein
MSLWLEARAIMAVTRAPRKTTKKPAAKAKKPAASAQEVAAPVVVAPAAPKHAPVVVTRSSMEDWPPQAELVLSAIEAGQHRMGYDAGRERRTSRRASFRVRAQLRLYSDNPGEPGRVIYTRDIHARGLGFITPHRLPLGHGGLVDLPTPAGKIVSVPCTLLRCREAAPGWYEGSVYFNREQQNLVPPLTVA